MKNLFAFMYEDEVIYTVWIFRGHIFRRYCSGFITTASEADIEAAADFNLI